MTRKSLKVVQPLIVGDKLTRGVSEAISTTPIEEIKEKLNQSMKSGEKKKRIPKPPITWAVDGVLRLIPFFCAKTTEERVRAAVAFVVWNDSQIGSRELNAALARNLEEIRHVDTLAEEIFKNSHDQIDVIEEAHTRIADAIRISLHQKEPNGYSRRTQEWLQEALSLSFRKVTWANRPFTSVSYQFRYELMKDGHGETLGFCRYAGLKFKNMAAGYVCEAFSARGGRSIGEFYIGACPRCGKVFKKMFQSNQGFCSGACKQADYRARKKLVTDS